MIKIKKTLKSILVVILLIKICFAPLTNIQASENTTSSAYLDYLTSEVKLGHNGSYNGAKGIQIPEATLFDSSNYDTSQSCFINTPKREDALCTDAYDMKTIASKYSTVLAFRAYNCHDTTVYARPAVGYKSDGTAEIIYDVDGYDALGYDIDGYNVRGYDRDKRNKKSFTVDKIEAYRNWQGKLCVNVLTLDGKKVSADNYKVTKKAILARKGCGTYEITVNLNEKYGSKVITQTFNILPNTGNVKCFLDESGYSSDSKYYTGKVDCRVIISYSTSDLKLCDGIQFVFSKDKNFKNIYAKGTISLKKRSDSEYYEYKKFQAKNGSKCYRKYRVYTVVNGKKIYSQWDTYCFDLDI